MKTILLKTKRNLFLLSLFLLGLFSFGQNKKPSNLQEEKNKKVQKEESRMHHRAVPNTTIYLPSSVKTPTAAVAEITNCARGLMIGSHTVSLCNATISIATFSNMEAAAKSLTVSGACTNSIAGLQMEYGIINNKIVLYYRPVKLCWLYDSYGQNYEHYGTFSLSAQGDSYTYTPGSSTFTPANASERASAVANYASSILIQHASTLAATVFTSGVDVTSLIFTFDEIDSLILDNPAATALKLWNCMREVNFEGNPALRHSLILSTNDLSVNDQPAMKMWFKNAIFKGNYANLSHLCPPSCGSALFTYQLFYLH